MKRFYISALFLFLFGSMASAQSLSLMLPAGNTIQNGDTVTVVDTNSTVSYNFIVWAINNSTTTKNVKVRRTPLSVVAGSENYFCWGNCYDTSVYVSLDSVSIAPKNIEKGFSGDYDSDGHSGKTTIRYTFFVTDNPNDTIAIIVEFVAGSSVAYENVQREVSISNAYPNPTKDRFFLDYNFADSRNAKVEIMNVVGNIVSEQYINPQSSHASINVENLSSGIYFYNVIVDGNKIASKKLIIQR